MLVYINIYILYWLAIICVFFVDELTSSERFHTIVLLRDFGIFDPHPFSACAGLSMEVICHGCSLYERHLSPIEQSAFRAQVEVCCCLPPYVGSTHWHCVRRTFVFALSCVLFEWRSVLCAHEMVAWILPPPSAQALRAGSDVRGISWKNVVFSDCVIDGRIRWKEFMLYFHCIIYGSENLAPTIPRS